jgi:thiol:disulfide interchange protein
VTDCVTSGSVTRPIGFSVADLGDQSVTRFRFLAEPLNTEAVMGIGAGLFLVAIGAVLTFAVNATVSGINIQTIGVILMIVGVVGIALDLAIFAPRRRTVSTTEGVPVESTGTARRTVVEDRTV